MLPGEYFPKPPPRRSKNRKKTPKGLEEFDPFHSMHYDRYHPEHKYQTLIGEFSSEGDVEEEGAKRIINWRFFEGVENFLAPKIMSKLEKAVDKIHKLRYSYAYKLRNIENEETMADYKDNASPWFENLRATAKWFKEKKKNVFDERELRLRILNGFLKTTLWLKLKQFWTRNSLRKLGREFYQRG